VADQEKSFQIYQFHVLLRGVNPPVWRRLLMRSNNTIADLHYAIQIAFNWTDFHLHRFLIHGKEYGIGRAGCTGFSTSAKQTFLMDFHFRDRERFLYEYDFGDLWQHQVRFETVRPIETRKTYPVCIGGSRAAPPEDCGGPEAYMELMDRHFLNLPYEELSFVAETVRKFLNMKADEPIRAGLGNMDELQEAVINIEEYFRFRPDHFDRRTVNRRLKQYAADDKEWLWE
jgi:hypothetical protein